jgi:hypothetical protein
LIIAFGLSFYIVWTFPWIRDSFGRKLGGLFFVAALLCILGDYVWPQGAQVNLPKYQQPVAKQPITETVTKSDLENMERRLLEKLQTQSTASKDTLEKNILQGISCSQAINTPILFP